jgi:hypothetical protein
VAWRKRNTFKEIFTQRNCGSPKEETATEMKITRSAGRRRMGQDEDNVEKETPKRTERNRRWKYHECNNSIRDRDLKQRLRGSKQMKDPTTNGIKRMYGTKFLYELLY